MNKMNHVKRIGAWLLVCLLLICAAPVSVFADICCWFEIEEVTQTGAGLVVSYSSYSDLASRHFSASLCYLNATTGNVISVLWDKSNIVIPSDGQGTYTIPADEYSLVSGLTYRLSMNTNDTCDSIY